MMILLLNRINFGSYNSIDSSRKFDSFFRFLFFVDLIIMMGFSMFFWKFFGDFVDFCRLFLLDFVLDSFFFL